MLSSDLPIEDYDDDILDRKFFVNQIKNVIVNYEDKNSLTIGLEGSWGSGKTSIINLLKNELIDENYNIVNFNPWFFLDDTNITEVFFNELNSQIEQNNKLKFLHDNLKKYQHILSPTINISSTILQSIMGIPIKNITDEINSKIFDSNTPSIYELKKSLNEELDKLDKKIIVIIDDIDRLTDEHIKEIFNLTAAVANFNNIIYILAYDKKVVLKSLEKSQKSSSKEYLEKIIQLPISIPKITNYDIKKYFYGNIQVMAEKSLINLEEFNSLLNYYSLFEDYFDNIRDIKRYFNLIFLYLPVVLMEVNTVDFMLITLIQIFENEVYHLIKNNPTYILNGKHSFKIGNEYERFSKENTGFYQLLYNHFQNNKKLELLLLNIFPKLKEIYEKNTKFSLSNDICTERKISCSDYFDNYFIYGVAEYDISEKEIDNLFVIESEKIQEELIKYISLNKKEIIVKKLTFRAKNTNKNDSKKIFKSFLKVSDEYDCILHSRFLLLNYLDNLNEDEKFKLIQEVINEFSFNYGLFNLIYSEYLHNQKQDGFLNNENFKKVMKRYIQKIKTYDKRELLENKHAYDLFLCLKNMINKKEYTEFIYKCISTNTYLFKFIECFIIEEDKSIYDLISIKNNRQEINKRLRIDKMNELFEPKIIKDRIDKISNDTLNEHEQYIKDLFNKEYSINNIIGMV